VDLNCPSSSCHRHRHCPATAPAARAFHQLRSIGWRVDHLAEKTAATGQPNNALQSRISIALSTGIRHTARMSEEISKEVQDAVGRMARNDPAMTSLDLQSE